MLPLSEMTFIGPVTVGGPDVTLQGDASSIYGQILALNPTFDANTFGHSVAEAIDSVSAERSLDTRQTTTNNWNCDNGVFVERYHSQCANAINDLIALGAARCVVAPNSCARVSCSDSCSIYLCNNHTQVARGEVFPRGEIYCRDIAVNVGTIVGKCGSDNGNGDTRARGSLDRRRHYTTLTQEAC
ncbi:hypothetical protein LY78DRAFT_716084 [Colletotrichum sublineola]|nr:hypothetical protein LY78DRAFT_716084 [Colletotrichum sublineola]